MSLDLLEEMLARHKARMDWKDKPEAFLKGDTNGFDEEADPEMFESYESERQLIIHDLRKGQ